MHTISKARSTGATLPACLALTIFCGGLIAAEVALADEAVGKTAKLKKLPKSRLLLQAPQDVKGDFAVAKEAPQVEFAYFPNQWEGARLWSSWGDSLAATDGNFYASIGDHAAPHGTAYVYRIDPEASAVTLVVDYNAVVGIKDEEKYTPGKIHGGLVDGEDGWIYFFGYRGSVRRTGEDSGYRGDWLLRYNMQSGKTENLGIAVPYCSVPVLLFHSASRSLYGLAVPGKTAPKQEDRFFRYGIDEGKLAFVGGPVPNMSRALILARDGRAWYTHSAGKGSPGVFVRYEPGKNRPVVTDLKVPGNGQLRAASRPDAKGVAYCLSRDGVLFSFDTNREKVAELGTAFATEPLYTAACRLDPTGRYLYYVPGAHGRTSRNGTAVIQFDTKTKKHKVIAFLNALLRKEEDYNLGGTYGLALSEDGSTLCINFNGAPLGNKQPDFGKCSAVLLRIPESER